MVSLYDEQIIFVVHLWARCFTKGPHIYNTQLGNMPYLWKIRCIYKVYLRHIIPQLFSHLSTIISFTNARLSFNSFVTNLDTASLLHFFFAMRSTTQTLPRHQNGNPRLCVKHTKWRVVRKYTRIHYGMRACHFADTIYIKKLKDYSLIQSGTDYWKICVISV